VADKLRRYYTSFKRIDIIQHPPINRLAVGRENSRTKTCSLHERKSRGDESPQNWQWGDANTSCPPDFCHVSKFQSLAMYSSPSRFQPRFTPLVLLFFCLLCILGRCDGRVLLLSLSPWSVTVKFISNGTDDATSYCLVRCESVVEPFPEPP
jgi:hypothetical protein